MTDLLNVRDLHLDYAGDRGDALPAPAVRGVSFDIGRREIYGVVGESGSGKSSVCAALTGVLPPGAHRRASRILFDGTDLTGLDAEAMRRLRASRIGFVPQRPMTSLSPATPVLRQLRWYADRDELPDLLDRIGLRAVLDRPHDHPHRFSGGQLQRTLVVLAALARRPDLLIADEPTTTLDATVQAQVLRLLLDLRERPGLSILYVTHDLAVVAQICDRVGVMYGGRLVESGDVERIFSAPRHPYTKALLAALPGRTPVGRRLGTIPGTAMGAARHPGCPFAPRCPAALQVCRDHDPEPTVMGTTTVRCHRAEEPL